MTEGLKSGNGANNGYRAGGPEEKPDFWREIEKKYFETSSNVRDWEGFKKEYYKLEHLIKQSLDDLHKFQIDFSKKITYIENQGSLGDIENNGSLYSKTSIDENIQKELENFKRISGSAFDKLTEMENLINSLKLRQQEPQNFVKMNMLQRFKEIVKDHQNDYNRSISSIEFNKKKYELFKNAFALARKQNHEVTSRTKSLIDEQNALDNTINMTGQIISHAKDIRISFNNQKSTMAKISQRAHSLKENFPGIGKLISRIQRSKLKREFIIGLVISICVLITFYTIFYSN